MNAFATSAAFLLAVTLAAGGESPGNQRHVHLMRAPDGGIQPQAAVAEDGAVHLIWYKGPDGGGDIWHAMREPGEPAFSTPKRVNHQDGSAIAAGTIRGAQLALGRNGRPHVIWNGGKGAARIKINGKEETPLLYTRGNDDGTGFEPERNLITMAPGLDGGSAIAADRDGNVHALWHASIPGKPEGEANRAVFIARSSDDGKSFRPETLAVADPTGACGCCGMRAMADRSGAVYVLYRGAMETVNRPEILLVSPEPGAPFRVEYSHPWQIAACPMSSAVLAEGGPSQMLAGWETAGQVFFTRIRREGSAAPKLFSPAGSAKRKHPVLAVNKDGQTLLVWTEGTGWAKGGSMAWQIYSPSGLPIGEPGRMDGVPVWSFAAAFAEPDGSFVIVY